MGIIITVICIFYGVASHWFAKETPNTDIIIDAEAGAISESHCNFEKRNTPVKIIQLPNCKLSDSRNYVRIRIRGNCMEPRGILNGEQWLVSRINHEKTASETIKKGDVVLIYLKDKDLYKIREVKDILPDNRLDTIWYDNGVEHKSSKPHLYSDTIGIVKYAI